jgi:hypothetical protein
LIMTSIQALTMGAVEHLIRNLLL